MSTPKIPATPRLGSDSVALDAYRDLMTGPVPQNETHFRRAIMLAVLIGRQIESEDSTTRSKPRTARVAGAGRRREDGK